jgi:hypothetical protein
VIKKWSLYSCATLFQERNDSLGLIGRAVAMVLCMFAEVDELKFFVLGIVAHFGKKSCSTVATSEDRRPKRCHRTALTVRRGNVEGDKS